MANLADLMQSFFNKGATAANVLAGRQTFAATTGATNLLTIPANRTWVGKIGASVSCQNAAAALTAAQADVVFNTGGGGQTPSGNVFGVTCRAGANAAAGTVGSQDNNFGQTNLIVVAGANPSPIQVTVTIAGTAGVVDAFAIGQLI